MLRDQLDKLHPLIKLMQSQKEDVGLKLKSEDAGTDTSPRFPAASRVRMGSRRCNG